MVALDDLALERSRRAAWAKYYAARDDARLAVLHAVELAEWLDQSCRVLPPEAVSLVELVRRSAGFDTVDVCRRYVSLHRLQSVPASGTVGDVEANLERNT